MNGIGYHGHFMNVLGIESSCDETAAAVVASGPCVLANLVSSQVETHARFGGVVPEVASREHILRIGPVVQNVLDQVSHVDAVAATIGPGLLGALLVGAQFAKAFALARGIPFIGINHLEGHLAAALLAPEAPPFPQIVLVVSGGHTHLYLARAWGDYTLLGGTRDDAAGEAFDKVAKLLGLGYPGGVCIDRTAVGGNPHAVELPRGLKFHPSYEFSFSGLKTSAANYLATHSLSGDALRDFCASLQEAIADVLVHKTMRAAKEYGVKTIVLAGGVAANSRLRSLLDERCAASGIRGFAPPKALCTDNAAMIAMAGLQRLERGEQSPMDVPIRSRWPLAPPLPRDPRIKGRRA